MPSAPADLVAVPAAYQTGPEWTRTAGPEVAELAELADFAPDPEQRVGLDMLFALNSEGYSAAFEFAVICARQNLKTGLLKMAALGWLFITEEELIVWSAHEFSTTREAHRDMVELITSCPPLARRIANIYDSSNDKSIHLKPKRGRRFGPRLIFKARTQSGGRGLTGDKVILDEALYLQPEHMGSLVPTLAVRPDPQLIYASSAGLVKSAVLRKVRDRGRRSLSPRLAYLEYCAEAGGCARDACDHEPGTEGCALDKFENLQAANPLLGRRRANGTGLTLEYLAAERNALTPAAYGRERLGWWDDPGAAEVFGVGKWEACGGSTPQARLLVAAVAVSVNLDSAAVVGVGMVGARTFVQVLAHGPGFDWVPEQIPEGVRVVIDPKGPAAVVRPELKAAHVRLIDAKPADVYDAFDAMLSLVKGGTLLHDNDPVLTRSANGAIPQIVGDRRKWGRRLATSDITAIEAASFAAWWATRPKGEPPPEPAPPQLVSAVASHNDLTTMGF